MYAMKLLPVFKDYLWGGERLENEFGFRSGFEKTAEAWILSAHNDGENIIENGKYKGMSFKEVIGVHPEFIKKGWTGDFPVLIKFIDAKDKLSVQVHPGEEYAIKNENDHGKTEAWYILDAEENSELILGLNGDITKEEFEKKIINDTVCESVNRVKVKKGEIYLIPSGTLHAIGKGILICEIQQNSNVTYRVYDYGRLNNGKKRPLHIEKALDVIDFSPYKNTKPDGEELVRCDIFRIDKVFVNKKTDFYASDESFISLVCIDGEGTVGLAEEKQPVTKGDSFFIPASSGKYTLDGNMTLLVTRLP